jgi:integrase/recombinase XerD
MYENEQIKRQFFEHLKGAEGFAKTSVNTFAEAIGQWQLFTNDDDFGNFNKSQALAYREWLAGRETKTKAGRLSLVTQYNYLRRIKRFFSWLAEQQGFKSKIQKNDIEFLRLSKKDALIARSGTTKTMPTFEEVKAIIESIEIKNEIDRRDRALICFALITGCRISAIVSLKMKNFDKVKKLIDQNPGDGVRTKNSKKILTTFFPIRWDEPEQHFMDWYEYLEKKGFGPEDPLFPVTKGEIGSAYSKEFVGRAFWNDSSAARKIFEKRCKGADLPYFHPHSFRHLVVNIMSKTRLTEEEKRAISLNLGHSNVGTTFGSYGYGNMNEEDAVKIVQRLKDSQNTEAGGPVLNAEEKALLERLLGRL